jgi:deoxycytidine triphosphate deaminase
MQQKKTPYRNIASIVFLSYTDFPQVSKSQMLSDRDLKSLVPAMDFKTAESALPFDIDKQIHACSINLRLDKCFWFFRKMRRNFRIDLRKPDVGELYVRRAFRQRWYRAGDAITVAPGEMILGRTFEEFQIPNGYAGKLEGRSTFSRMGISIHCTGDFINPGWRGRMPLQLVNNSPIPINLTPHMEICQLLVIRTSSESDKPYGIGQKYHNDDGGPTKFWADTSLIALRESLQRIPGKWAGDIIRLLGERDSELIDDCAQFLSSIPTEKASNAREAMEMFAKTDTKNYKRTKGGLWFCQWVPGIIIATGAGIFFATPYGRLHYLCWIASIIMFPILIWASVYAEEPRKPFIQKDVDEIFKPHIQPN